MTGSPAETEVRMKWLLKWFSWYWCFIVLDLTFVMNLYSCRILMAINEVLLISFTFLFHHTGGIITKHTCGPCRTHCQAPGVEDGLCHVHHNVPSFWISWLRNRLWTHAVTWVEVQIVIAGAFSGGLTWEGNELSPVLAMKMDVTEGSGRSSWQPTRSLLPALYNLPVQSAEKSVWEINSGADLLSPNIYCYDSTVMKYGVIYKYLKRRNMGRN